MMQALPEVALLRKSCPIQFGRPYHPPRVRQATETWWFIIDIVQVLTTRKRPWYWVQEKQRVKAEDGATVEKNCQG